MRAEATTSKAENTAVKILDAALHLFRLEGFESATMRDIARHAGVATGAAYYYYPSKDAIVLEFYKRSNDAMQPAIEEAVTNAKSLETALKAVIGVKLTQFRPNREVLRSLLRNGADPSYPLSPFSTDTKAIRDGDIACFQRILANHQLHIPRDLRPHLPGVLWFFQMGIIFFWITDGSANEGRTEKLLTLACKIVASLIRLSSLPLMRPVRKPVIDLINIVVGEGQ